MGDKRKMPLMAKQLAWTISEKDGAFYSIFGPNPLKEITPEDFPIVPDPRSPGNVVRVDDILEAIQDFITLDPNTYAVLSNPAINFTLDYPNGSFSKGRKNDMADLDYGGKRIIVSGCFPLWPGQEIEVREVHRLLADEYLMVEVESEKVDKDAPYYELTVKCAKIKKAMVDQTVQSLDRQAETKEIIDDDQKKDNADSVVDEVKGTKETPELVEGDLEKKEEDDEVFQEEKSIFKIGQRIIIPGNMTSTYIPPSGIKIISEQKEGESSGEDFSNLSTESIIERFIESGDLKIENLKDIFLNISISEETYDEVREHYQYLRNENQGRHALKLAIFKEIGRNNTQALAHYLIAEHNNKDLTSFDIVQKARVPGPTQFCVLIDEDGTPGTYKGPGRVFPRPYERFRTQGSRDGIYDAYHLRPDRGILLRVVAEEISKSDLAKQLPAGSQLEKNMYSKGDEIFIHGFDAYLVPSNSIEVINPETRQPHIGNDHSEVYVQAIGVDQKSGVYVADVETGNVELIKGKKKLILDPRKQKHIKRKVPGYLWNMMIGHAEPHKKASEGSLVETPWALSVSIFNNQAALVTSKDDRRVVMGPGTELLEYEERMEILSFSTSDRGQPKTSERPLRTCFLRVTGNRITDRVEIETADFVRLFIDVSYGVYFKGETDEEREAWFNHRDYVGLFCEHLRSRIRAAGHKVTIIELYPVVAEFVRDNILGKKPKNKKHRPGLEFSENNMVVNEVEVLAYGIPDENISYAMTESNRQIVTQQIHDAASWASLESKKALDEIDKEEQRLRVVSAQRKRDADIQAAKAANEAERERYKLAHAQAVEIEEQRYALENKKNGTNDMIAKSIRERTWLDSLSQIKIKDVSRQKVVQFKRLLVKVQESLAQTLANADATRLEAIQPGLVEALNALGNKELATALAENLPQASGTAGLLLGQGGLAALKKMVGGTVLEGAFDALDKTVTSLEREADRTEGELEE